MPFPLDDECHLTFRKTTVSGSLFISHISNLHGSEYSDTNVSIYTYACIYIQ